MEEIRIFDPKTLKQKIKEAKRLRKEGKRVCIIVDDIDKLCKVHDADTIAELLDGIPFYDAEEYSWAQLAMKARQQLIKDEEASPGN